MSKKISVVIPTIDENDESYLLKFAASYPSDREIEYWIVDKGSPKSLLSKINRSDFNILSVDAATRAERLDLGFKRATSNFILFHHPRSILPPEALLYLKTNQKSLIWGGFRHRFDQTDLGLNFTSWYSNHVRPHTSRIVYLDHCIFFKKDCLNQKIPIIPIFEDTEISKILNKSGPPTILPFESITSSIRFEKNGFLKQATKNQLLKIAYHLGASKKIMNHFYEYKINLN